MALKFHHLSCTSYSLLLIIIFSLSYCLTICQSHSPISSPALDFLKELNGTHKGDQSKGLNKLKSYLTRLGYIDSTIPINKNDDIFDDTLEFAIKKYQKFYKLKITGFLDQETLTQMLQPRCGFPDFPTVTSKNTTGSYYEVTGYVWPRGKRLLTVATTEKVRLDAYVPIYTALDKWGNKNISTFRFDFANSYDEADVKISFEFGDHDDGYPFDGPGGILAHGFLPTDGRLHFDMSEDWSSKGEKDAYDIGTVALHEIGHILGLGHSDDRNALMFPEIKKGQTKEIAQDDIDGLRAIYPRG